MSRAGRSGERDQRRVEERETMQVVDDCTVNRVVKQAKRYCEGAYHWLSIEVFRGCGFLAHHEMAVCDEVYSFRSLKQCSSLHNPLCSQHLRGVMECIHGRYRVRNKINDNKSRWEKGFEEVGTMSLG